MFEIISKQQYWDALEDPLVQERMARTNREIVDLKHIQDAWMLSMLCRLKERRILEAGGGFGRVLRTLDGNERWNLDKESGPGRTKKGKRILMPIEINGVDAFLGEFSENVPSDYFDVVYSISVIEHIPLDSIEPFFRDHARILKEGGVGYHAVDLYVGDEGMPHVEKRLDTYLNAISSNNLLLLQKSGVTRPLVFRSKYASNPDLAMLYWNKIVPKLSKQRAELQSVCLLIIVTKQ